MNSDRTLISRTVLNYSLLWFISLLTLFLQHMVKCEYLDVTVASTQFPSEGKSQIPPSFTRNNDSIDQFEIEDVYRKPPEPCSDNNTSNTCIFEERTVPGILKLFGVLVWFLHWTEREKWEMHTIQQFKGIETFLTVADYLHAILLAVASPLLYLSATAVLLTHRKPYSRRSSTENDIFNSENTETEGFYRAYARPVPQRVGDAGWRQSANSDMPDIFPMMGYSSRTDDNLNVMDTNNSCYAEITTRL